MSGIRHRQSVQGMPLSPREVEVLRTYATTGDHGDTAAALGISRHSVKNILSDCYAKMGVRGHLDAFRLLGWLEVRP